MKPMFRLKPLAALCCACFFASTGSLQAEEPNNEVTSPYQTQIEQGLGYLLSQQKRDGSWGEGAEAIHLTTAAVDALYHHHIRSIEYQRAVTWLANHPGEDAATLARQIVVLKKTAAIPYSLINKLKTLKRTVSFQVGDKWQDAYTWSVKPRFQTTLIDTALSGLAMMASGNYNDMAISRYYAYPFQALQHTDTPGHFTDPKGHGWGYADIFHGKKTPEKVLPTAYAARFMHSVIVRYKTAEEREKGYLPNYGNYAKAGALWLASHQQASGAITDTPNLAIYETAEALLTLQIFKVFHPEPLLFTDTLKKGRDYLIQQMQSNGSWKNDVLITALVVNALDTDGIILKNTDDDWLPDSLEAAVGRDANKYDPPAIYQPESNGVVQTRLKMVSVLAGSNLPALDPLGGKVVQVITELPTTNGLLSQPGLYMRIYIIELTDGSQQVVSVPVYVSSPEADNDNDYMLARFEANHHLNDFNPADALDDTDTDGLTHVEEYWSATQPFVNDSDHDQMPDGFEVRYRLNPNNPADAKQDPDQDQLNNLQEYQWQSNPRLADTDNDGIQDGEEVKQKRHPAVHEPALQIVLDYLL
ncbi:hypothetical protein [Spartinivicinus marinus]|uniref:hypothetical protein n=1 Tax=Spartinivicinus marinus TaxID=2994442 RepID=UPI0022552113|nr:hypothetical protein [Spartinivicinus marinus]MCX4030263.1 hypothetical protein [Spartinivicinus marinus]